MIDDRMSARVKRAQQSTGIGERRLDQALDFFVTVLSEVTVVIGFWNFYFNISFAKTFSFSFRRAIAEMGRFRSNVAVPIQ